MFWWTQAATDPGAEPVDLGILAQYGVLGVFAIVLLLFARISYRRETERADRLEAEVIRLNNLIIDRAVPALTAAAQAAEEATQLLRDLHRERELALRPPARRAREDRP
jgi:hypothetical protein